MRKILPVALVFASMGAFVQNGLAADIPMRAPARVAPMTAPVVHAFTWNGCYIGANVGYGWARKDWDGAGSHDADGVVGGGQVGCDLQTGAFVFGLEGMFDWTGMEGSHSRSFRVPGGRLSANFETEVSWVAAVTGRVGFALDRSLFYVKGGAAWADGDHAIRVAGVNFTGDSDTNSGWTVGAGVEWSFAPAWSAKLEYNFMDFGSDTNRFCARGVGCGSGVDVDQHIHLVTVGLNYRFSWH